MKVNLYEVDALNKVDTSIYKNGDLFITDRSFGVLINGKVKTLSGVNTSDFVKKEELVELKNKLDQVEDVLLYVSDFEPRETGDPNE